MPNPPAIARPRGAAFVEAANALIGTGLDQIGQLELLRRGFDEIRVVDADDAAGVRLQMIGHDVRMKHFVPHPYA